ncbi:MAG TPA: 4a-hydroxytetrahydrobiopterin dehydratase [Armatimonadota bacterium]|nr:4a-hydroxytetrahydrobiopterin dehydratase [Armatimonadota bacterium]
MTEQRLADDEIRKALGQVPDWELLRNSIRREFKFANFDQAMDFVNKVAEVARKMDHHPDICIYYNRVDLELSTHKAGGLTGEDFELAARINEISEQ